jgi:hypothetical protein
MNKNGCCTRTSLPQKHGQKSTHLEDYGLTHELGDLTHEILLKKAGNEGKRRGDIELSWGAISEKRGCRGMGLVTIF